MKKILIAVLLLCTARVNAQVADTLGGSGTIPLTKAPKLRADTVEYLHARPWTIIVPAGLVTYGVASLAINPVRNVDYYIAGRIKRSDPNFNSKIDNYIQVAPIALVYGLNLVGDYGKNRFVDRTALLALSGGILTVADGLKFVTHRARPYSNDKLSFPSGHTGAAFLAAEYLAQEYGEKSPVYSVIGYSFAVGTSVMRLYNREHWFSDVVAGAGFGILSTKAAYLIYPHIRNSLTHHGKHGRTTMLMPSYQYGAPGLSFAAPL